MTNINILQVIIILALMDGIASQCWNFESSFDGWLNNGWKHAPDEVPDTEHILNYNPPTDAYVWLQEQVEPPRNGSLSSPTITIQDGDIVSATFYRHMVVMDGTDRLNMTFFTENNNKLIFSSENYDVWAAMSITCSSADIHCCSVYPCTGYFVINGSVESQNDLMAVNFVGINCISPSTIPSSSGTTTSTTERTTATTATLITSSFTPSSTSVNPSTTTEISPITSIPSSTTDVTPLTTSETSTSSSETSTPSSETSTPSSETSTPSSETSTPSSDTSTPSRGTPTSSSVTSSTMTPYPDAYCCTFDYDTCGWSIEQVSNGWHWSVYKQPALTPPFSSEYIWLEDTSAGVSSSSINDVVSGTIFSLTYYFATDSPNTNNSMVLFGDVELGNLIANEDVQTFRYTCGDECCEDMTSCSGQFTIEIFNEPGESLSISIDEFHVNDVTCI